MRSFNFVSFPRKRDPEPRHARPSLDARFRGHDTDVSESSPILNDSHARYIDGEIHLRPISARYIHREKS